MLACPSRGTSRSYESSFITCYAKFVTRIWDVTDVRHMVTLFHTFAFFRGIWLLLCVPERFDALRQYWDVYLCVFS